jgi:hypothetical protein
MGGTGKGRPKLWGNNRFPIDNVVRFIHPPLIDPHSPICAFRGPTQSHSTGQSGQVCNAANFCTNSWLANPGVGVGVGIGNGIVNGGYYGRR